MREKGGGGLYVIHSDSLFKQKLRKIGRCETWSHPISLIFFFFFLQFFFFFFFNRVWGLKNLKFKLKVKENKSV